MNSDPSDAAGVGTPTAHRRRVLHAAAGFGAAAAVGTGTTGFARAQDADAGAERWRFDVPLDAFSSPTVADGTVFLGTQTLDDDVGDIYALDADSGDEVWHVETGQAAFSSPTVADGTVFVGTVDIDASDFSDSEGIVRALAAATGDEHWQTQVGTEILSSPTVVDGTLFVGCWYDNGDGETGGRLVALNAGVDGSSDGSRVVLGTLGHHGGWRYADQTIDAVTPAEPTAGTAANGPETDGESTEVGQGDGTQTDAVGPGFGPASALTGLGGAAALLGRRFADDERDAE